MPTMSYDIYNVFAQSTWGGNPLAIVPHADDLSSNEMQLIARQFNLSETVFIYNIAHNRADLRIFTPDHEMPFAGHPTIGASAWLHQNMGFADAFVLNTPAKTVQIKHCDGRYQFTLTGYQSQPCHLNTAQLANALGLELGEIQAGTCWMNAGTWQLIVPLSHMDGRIHH